MCWFCVSTKTEFLVVLANYFLFKRTWDIKRSGNYAKEKMLVPHIYNSILWFYDIIFKLNHEQLNALHLDIHVYKMQ